MGPGERFRRRTFIPERELTALCEYIFSPPLSFKKKKKKRKEENNTKEKQ